MPVTIAASGQDPSRQKALDDLERLQEALAKWQCAHATVQATPWNFSGESITQERVQRRLVQGNVERAKDLLRGAGLEVEMDVEGQSTALFDAVFIEALAGLCLALEDAGKIV